MNVYVLDESGQPVLEPNLMKWAVWFETADRQVAETTTANVRISTVFLGLDHGWSQLGHPFEHEPVLWETMVFGASIPREIQLRYQSRDDALSGHEVVVAEVERQLREAYLDRAKHRG